MEAKIILTILFIHWIADFICQTDWQAKNKSINNYALTAHALIYSMIWVVPVIIMIGVQKSWYFVVITFMCHWVTDYFTSRLNSKLWKEQKVHWFFVSVGFDQFLHYAQLILLYQTLTINQ